MKSVWQIVSTTILSVHLVMVSACKPFEDSEQIAEVPEAPAPAAQAAPQPEAEALLDPPEPLTPEQSVDTTSRVSILGYHRFSETDKISRRLAPTTIHIEKFRAQLQTLLDNEIPVISMSDFLAWRRGEKNIPPFSIIITIDDGWKSTHTLALPILKEFKFPFTIYFYSKFLNSGGKTLSYEQIAEMVAAGGDIGSHSVSHADLRKQGRRTDEMQAAYLAEETAGSRRILKERLGVDPVTFSYPYGAYNDKVIQAATDAGYEAMVTIRGKVVGWDTDLKELGRYIVHGTDDRAFDWALSSRLPAGTAGANNILKEMKVDEATGEEKPLIQVYPTYGSIIKERRPIISVNLSQIDDLDPKSVTMSISGIGGVEPKFDESTKTLSYRAKQRLRMPEYWAEVKFKRTGRKKPDILRWKFEIDPTPHLLAIAKGETPPETEAPVVEAPPEEEAPPTTTDTTPDN